MRLCNQRPHGGWAYETPEVLGQSCPNTRCAQHNLVNKGNVSAIATYMTQSSKGCLFRCKTYTTTSAETRDTVFFDLRPAEEKVMMPLKMLLVRVDLARISFVLGITEGTVLVWHARAAQS